MHPQTRTRNCQWLAQRNLVFDVQVGDCLPQEAITYCLVFLARHPSQVPLEVIEELVRAGHLQVLEG